MGVKLSGEKVLSNSLDELSELTRTAGGVVCERIVQNVRRIEPSTYIGKGKALELKELGKKHKVDLVIFDNDLSPTQIRNLEEIIELRVIDRTELILDIFAHHAHTKEAKLQVELAQLNYLLPRLRGKGILLSRLGGGIGTRGPGETKLEIDRRRIEKRIVSLKKSIKKVARVRTQQRKKRRNEVVASIIGYTNAGKSTLMKALTGEEVFIEDRLFSTLDPLTRRLTLPNNQCLLLIDTVGFIKNLPHHLITSFSATLEEVRSSDILLHVVDISSEKVYEEIDSVYEVLDGLKANTKYMITILNKIDKLRNKAIINRLIKKFPNSCALSCKTSEGLDKLIHILLNLPIFKRESLRIKIPFQKIGLRAFLFRNGWIKNEEYIDNNVVMDVELPFKIASKLKRWQICK
ncbi:MAG: GTPase HflX [bacterium]|nr:GTPase HflX [bacterium]